MPKIIVREYDKTKAGTLAYANFTVVVPGFVKSGTNPDTGRSYGYDEEGNDLFVNDNVYACSSQSDFVKYIGKVPGTTKPLSAAFAVCTKWEDELILKPAASLTVDEYTKYNGIIYKAEPTEEEVAGTLRFRILNGTEETPTYTYYKAIKVTKWEDIGTHACVLIKAGDEGRDEVQVPHNGNQIAYELLGLGYTVYYRKIDKDINELLDSSFWECFKDKTNYNFRYIISGGTYNTEVYKEIVKIAEHQNNIDKIDTPELVTGRGDCIALLDVVEHTLNTGSKVTAIKNQVSTWSFLDDSYNGKYAAIFCPQVIYNMDGEKDYDYNVTFPASFHYLASAVKAQENYREWYAVAGYNRGYSSRTVKATSFNLGEVAVNTLQPRVDADDPTKCLVHAVNPIINIRGNYYIWGNRTAHKVASGLGDDTGLVASHFLNIRQLCCTLKKEIYFACKELTFDPNSDLLWINFCNKVRPILDVMKADQGIQDYKLIKVVSNQKALLTAKVRIVPIEAVEDFDISVYLEDSVAGITVADTAE